MEGENAFLYKFKEIDIMNDQPNKSSKKSKIIIIILSCIIVVLIIIIILLIVLKDYNSQKNINKEKDNDSDQESEKKSEDKKEENPQEKSSEDIINFLRKTFCGDIYYNLPYAEETIKNTFKLNGDNYREEIGEINGNENYKGNSFFNKYDLYIPYSALKTKKTKGIILFIHGGAWIQGSKEEMSNLCQIYFEHEYIIANMDYTLLNENKKITIYRQLDEISACIENIKYRLKDVGFDENEMQVAVGGGSAGGHLALLYGYLLKVHPLPIKFIMEAIGPVNLETDDFYMIEKDEDTLPDIEPETVNKALQKNKYNKTLLADDFIVKLLNLFIGNQYNEEDLKGMLKDNKIDKKNEKYIELFEKAKYGFPLNWMEGKNIPILALYGGKDPLVGFVQYARLKETAIKNGNTIQIVYSRYGGHEFSEFVHPEGIIAAKDFHFYMLKFCEEYFNKY